MTPLPSELVNRFRRGDRAALARALTLVERQLRLRDAHDALDALLAALPEPAVRPLVVGVTGGAGAGKSTLIAALIEHLRARGLRVAVLACDPRSPVSGGALLGDRVRARIDPADEGVYFRSLSAAAGSGGLAAAVPLMTELLARFGFDVALVETIGAGQDQVAVRGVADVVVVLLTPGTGDWVQWQKAGLLEVADVIAVNKADLPGADALVAELRDTLELDASPVPVIAETTAAGGRPRGIAELWDEVTRTAETRKRKSAPPAPPAGE